MNETPADKLLLNLQCKDIELKDIDTLDDKELLKYLMDLVVHYDYLKDEELRLIDSDELPKNRDEWSVEDLDDYEELKLQIDTYYCRIREIARKLYGMNDFWYC